MLASRFRRTRRRGLTVVEATLVMSVFLLLLFGMFEYCRFLLVLHVTNNAAREGARYAVANVSDKPDDFDYNDFTDGSGKRFDNIQKYTTARMGGIQTRNIGGYRVACYAVDPAGLALDPPVVLPKAKTGATATPDPFNNTDPNRVPWRSAPFPQKIAVTIDGTYRPILPTFLMMPSTISVRTTALMGSEG